MARVLFVNVRHCGRPDAAGRDAELTTSASCETLNSRFKTSIGETSTVDDRSNDNDIPDDIEGGPYKPTEEDFLPSPTKLQGPLELPPDFRSLFVTLKFYAFICLASYAYWQGQLPDFAVTRRAVFEGGEHWRLFTAIFVHADLGHLLSNTSMLVVFGWFLNFHFGWRAFPFFSLVVGALANLVTIYFYPPDTRLVGASGMIYGMVALWLTWYISFDVSRPIMIRIARAVAFALVVMFPTTFKPSTSYMAHAAGFFLGLLLAFFVKQTMDPNKERY